jgi:hypothetical protein
MWSVCTSSCHGRQGGLAACGQTKQLRGQLLSQCKTGVSILYKIPVLGHYTPKKWTVWTSCDMKFCCQDWNITNLLLAGILKLVSCLQRPRPSETFFIKSQ